MSGTSTINLVVTTDDHYIVLLAALIRSVECNLSAAARLNIWVIEDGVKMSARSNLNASVNHSITSIQWINIDDAVNNKQLPNDRSSYPLNIYARLFIPYLLPAGIDKVLYLDVDMLVLTDLLTLWNTDISGHLLAAVTDARVPTFDNNWGGILNYKELGLDGRSKYFNTGVLLINNRVWRANNITQQILDTVDRNLNYAQYPDQYGLNIVANNKWLELDARWNTFATTPADDPYIIHFVDRKPIYASYKNSEVYRHHFYTYLQGTPWQHMQPITEMQRRIKKIKNILSKFHFPRWRKKEAA